MKAERVVFIMLSAVVTMWGLNVVMVKYLSFFPPVLLSAIRISIGTMAILPIACRKDGLVRLGKKDWLLIFAIAATTIVLHQITYAWGLQLTTAGNGALILALNPLTTALLSAIFLNEKLSLRKLTGVISGFLGVVLVVVGQHGDMALRGWGDLIMVFSMLMYAIGGLLVKKATNKGIPVLAVTAYSHVLSSLILWASSLAIYPAEVFASLDSGWFAWFLLLVSGGISTGLGTLGWNYGIGKLGASRTAIFQNGMPLASLFFAALFLGEPLRGVHVIAFILIVGGVYLGSQQIRAPKKSQPVIRPVEMK